MRQPSGHNGPEFMALRGQSRWPSAGNSLAIYGQFFMAANIQAPCSRMEHLDKGQILRCLLLRVSPR